MSLPSSERAGVIVSAESDVSRMKVVAFPNVASLCLSRNQIVIAIAAIEKRAAAIHTGRNRLCRAEDGAGQPSALPQHPPRLREGRSGIADQHVAPPAEDAVNGAVGEIERIARETAAAVLQVGSATAQIAGQTRMIRERVGAFTEEVHAIRA